MPVLKDFRHTKVVTLPSFPDSKVEIYDSLLVGQMKDVDFGEKNIIKLGVKSLPYFIKSWNFTSEGGEVLEINEANLGFLKEEDLIFLVDQLRDYVAEGKKKEKE